MLTEAEAMNKRCCGPEGCGEVPRPSLKDGRHCVGARCMAWRKVDQVGIGPEGEKRDRDMDGRTRWVDRGYCGLAGVAQKGFA